MRKLVESKLIHRHYTGVALCSSLFVMFDKYSEVEYIGKAHTAPSVGEMDVYLSIIRFSQLHVTWDKERSPIRRENGIMSLFQ